MFLIYAVFAMVVLLLISSLAVDLGRVQLAKTEMQCAVDAAARAAVAYLPDDQAGARAAAISMAAAHTVDGRPLVLQSGDVVFGKWNATTKVLDTTSWAPDAAQVTGYRTTARGTSIPMTLAKASGFTDFDLTFTETAFGNPGSSAYGILGLSSLTLSTAAFTGTYDSTTAVFTTGASSHDGSVSSNGTMTLAADASVGGVVYYNTASAPAGTSYSEGKTKMPSAAVTPATPDAGAYTTSNSNPSMGLPTTGATANVSGATYTVPGGNYVFNSASLSSATIQFTGPATIWMYGPMSLSASSILAYQNKPTNLQLKVCTSTSLTMSGASTLYAVVTAPSSSVTLAGSSKLVGSVAASSVSATSSAVYYDKQLGINGLNDDGGSTVVK
jgi:Flp pilus assembly protein TadG